MALGKRIKMSAGMLVEYKNTKITTWFGQYTFKGKVSIKLKKKYDSLYVFAGEAIVRRPVVFCNFFPPFSGTCYHLRFQLLDIELVDN